MVIAQRNNREQKSNIQFQSNGHFLQQIDSLQISTAQLPSKLNELLGLNSNYTFTLFNSQKDDIGMLHQSYQQFYKEIKVQDNMVLVHSKGDKVMALNGDVILEDEINIIPNITKTQAIQKAVNNKNVEGEIKESSTTLLIATKLVEQNKKQTALCYEVVLPTLKVYINAQNGEVFNELSLVAHGNVVGSGNSHYSGTVNFNCDNIGANQYLLRDINRNIETYNASNSSFDLTNGMINSSNSTIYTSESVNWNFAHKLDTIIVNSLLTNTWFTPIIDEEVDLFIKIRNEQGQVIYTSSVLNNVSVPITITGIPKGIYKNGYTVEFLDDDLGLNDFIASFIINDVSFGNHNFVTSECLGTYFMQNTNSPIIDIHWGAEKSYDFFFQKFGRNSYDNQGGLTKQYVFPQTPIFNNAFGVSGVGLNYMVYVNSNQLTKDLLVSLDVLGHEFTHLVTGNNGNGGLIYLNESGALNESFSDIFGTCIEFYVGNNPDYLIGKEITIPQGGIRNMSNPLQFDQPNMYNGTNWQDYNSNTSDDGGVHKNSGVQNRWFYLLCAGGSQNGYSVPANVVGMDKASKICYNTLMHFLTPNATYVDARNTSMLNTIYFYGYNSPEYLAVESAWNAVNVLAPSPLSPSYIPPQTCVGDVILTSNFAFFNDGSGSSNYSDYNNCSWLIQPTNGASSLQLWFDSFDLITGDTLWIHEGTNSSGNLLGAYTNTFTPPSFTTTGGEFYLKFKSNWAFSAQGFSAHYLATMNTAIGDYEYWFDNNYGNKVVGNNSSTGNLFELALNASTANLATSQIHTFHIRCKNSIGLWSSVLSHDFYNAGQSKINTYEYWFDEDINNKVSQSLASPVSFLNISPLNSTISAAALSHGIHSFHFRAKNELGVWSSVMSHSFYKSSTDNISEYEYWFDDDYNTKVTTPINSPQSVVELNIMNSNFSTANLAGGLHTFHFRAKNTSTVWSSVISHTFYKYSGSGLVSYQYWFDDDFSNAINSSTTGPMSMIDINNAISVSNLNNGLHKLHFRSKDESGYWSSVISHDFFIMGAKLVAYEYWFNSDYSNKVVQSIALSNEYSLQTTFNVNTLALGSNVVNIRFKDNAGMWSSTLTHGFCKGIGDSAISIKFLLEGFYAGNHQMHAVLINQGVSNDNSITDSVEVQLRNSTTPFGLVASKYISQKKNGLVEFDMPTVPSGFYYIVVKHRNSLETWSSAPVYKGDCSMSYNFTTAATQAYGDNQVEVEQGVFAIYTGDINQDGFIDSFDFPALDTDIFNGVSGVYVNTDLNGDGFVDSFDFPLFDVNSFNGVTVMTP